MSKTFKFQYYDLSEDKEEMCLPYPISSDISAEHTFTDGSTWDVILWQFCKFLENTGYMNVTDRIRIVDEYGMQNRNGLFECVEKERDVDFKDWDWNPEIFDNYDKDAS